MKVVCIIPARYKSTRFPGKPLADIHGKPMIWWVYNRVKEVKDFSDVIVATDDERISDICKKYKMKVIMTKDDHPDHICRIWEVSESIQADYYMCVNGDEPMIDPDSIKKIIPDSINKGFYFGGAMRKLTSPTQVIDPGNIKIITNSANECIYMSRTPIPYPKSTLLYEFKKYVGIECFTKEALDFFVNTKMGEIEKIEDIDHIRFLENNKKLKFTMVDSESLSVDTPKDLEVVKSKMKGMI